MGVATSQMPIDDILQRHPPLLHLQVMYDLKVLHCLKIPVQLFIIQVFMAPQILFCCENSNKFHSKGMNNFSMSF